MKRRIVFGLAALVALLSMGVIYAATDGDNKELMVEISVTNLTRGQTFSPVFVVRHDLDAAPLYQLGQPPSDALANLAEDGATSAFVSELDADNNSSVGEARAISGLLAPGQTATAEFSITDGKKLLSIASMLVSTNDAFIGGNALDLSKSRTIYLNVYDAGSEANSEDCAYVPGPPCGAHGRPGHWRRRRLRPCPRRHPRRRRPGSSTTRLAQPCRQASNQDLDADPIATAISALHPAR